MLLFLALLVLYWIIHFQIRASRRRYLIETYGISFQKLRKLKSQELKLLRNRIDALRKSGDAYGLEELIRPYRWFNTKSDNLIILINQIFKPFKN